MMRTMSDLDEARLGAWLARTLPAFSGIKTLEKFAGGQSNPTYRLSDGDRDYVLRRKPFGVLLPSAHAIEREFRLLSALYPTGYPVPRAFALCEDSAVIGAPFYVMDMVEGRMFWNGALPEVEPELRGQHYDAMIDALAALHALEPEAIGLGDFGRPGNYFTRQIARWTKQYRAAQTNDIPEIDRLIDWLPKSVPEQTRSAIIHGDFRIDNLFFKPDAPVVAAVIDWELATIGDPLADFTYLAMNWAMAADGRSGLGGIDLAAQGLPTIEYVSARYCAATGRDTMPDLHWYFAYNLFRLASILQGVKKRLADGNASSADALAMAARIEPLAKAAWAQARQAGA
jgi:aminoglycoside phosphotransferase (APT) family kinase protein